MTADNDYRVDRLDAMDAVEEAKGRKTGVKKETRSARETPGKSSARAHRHGRSGRGEKKIEWREAE